MYLIGGYSLCGGEGVPQCLDVAEYRYGFLLYIRTSYFPTAEAVGCIWWVVCVCAAVRDLRHAWMQWSRSAFDWYAYDFSFCPTAEAVGCIFWGVWVCVVVRDSRHAWMRRGRVADEQYI